MRAREGRGAALKLAKGGDLPVLGDPTVAVGIIAIGLAIVVSRDAIAVTINILPCLVQRRLPLRSRRGVRRRRLSTALRLIVAGAVDRIPGAECRRAVGEIVVIHGLRIRIDRFQLRRPRGHLALVRQPCRILREQNAPDVRRRTIGNNAETQPPVADVGAGERVEEVDRRLAQPHNLGVGVGRDGLVLHRPRHVEHHHDIDVRYFELCRAGGRQAELVLAEHVHERGRQDRGGAPYDVRRIGGLARKADPRAAVILFGKVEVEHLGRFGLCRVGIGPAGHRAAPGEHARVARLLQAQLRHIGAADVDRRTDDADHRHDRRRGQHESVAALVAQKLCGAEPQPAEYGPSHGLTPLRPATPPTRLGRWYSRT